MIALAKSKTFDLALKAQLILGFLYFQIGCYDSVNLIELKGATMGTTYSIKFSTFNDSLDSLRIANKVDSLLLNINNQMSTWNNDSEISKFNKWVSLEPYFVSNEFLEVLNTSLSISKKTNGYFDIAIFDLMSMWGFGPSPKQGTPKNNSIDSVLQFTGYENLNVNNDSISKLHKNAKIDLNAIAKGYAVDNIFEYLKSEGFKNIFVEIGGEVRFSSKIGKKINWSIGIENPPAKTGDNQKFASILNLRDKSVATSGNYRNFINLDGEIFGHTINPKTGLPIKTNVLSVTVIAESCMDADAWATALMVLNFREGYEMIKKVKGLDVMWITENKQGDRQIIISGKIEMDEVLYPIASL